MSRPDELSRSLWKRSGGKGSLQMQSSIMNSEPKNLQDCSNLSGKTQINCEQRKGSSSCEDLIVPEINRGTFFEFSAEKDLDTAQTNYTDTNSSSLLNSSLKSSFGQKSFSRDIEENDESDEGHDYVPENINSKVMAPIPRFPFRTSPKVQTERDMIIFPKTSFTGFEEKSLSGLSIGDRTGINKEIFKSESKPNRSIWMLKEDTSVNLQVKQNFTIVCRFISY